MRIRITIGLLCSALAATAASPEIEERLSRLEQENRELQRQLEALAEPVTASADTAPSLSSRWRLGGQAGVGFFHSGPEGEYPEGDFRIDDARLQLDVMIADHVYGFIEAEFTERESPDENMRVGSLFVDVEDIASDHLGRGALVLRVGRFPIPFGEEYKHRYPAENPLISHSLADFWGVDEGVAVFGKAGRIDYIVAVQNGGYAQTFDGNSDKSVTGRVGYEPVAALRISLSAMRTGDLDVEKDELGEIWFGDDFLRPQSGPEQDGVFSAEFYQADVRWSWKHGHIAGAGGYMNYREDTDISTEGRTAWYASLEVVQDLTRSVYAAARGSLIDPDSSFCIPGLSPIRDDATSFQVTKIWRTGLGLGWRIQQDLTFKAEYVWERGELIDGARLDEQDMAAAEIAFAF